ncbi:MAG: hypothetical protein HYY40_03195 [Bacteroidetes bacterium]|nr:hypothetical protein [Bacteroidota bacterium]
MTRQFQTDTQTDRRKRKFSFFANALLKRKNKFATHNARVAQATQSDTQTKAYATLAFFPTPFY